MIKLKTKNQKPIETDAHFKYRCPNCGWDHWISLKESQTKNFKIVCDCDTIFKPKRIKNITIEYYKKSKQVVNKTETTKSQPQESEQKVLEKPTQSIDKSILDKCLKLLTQYGFTNSEAKTLILSAYDRLQVNDIGILIKNVLEFIGENKNE